MRIYQAVWGRIKKFFGVIDENLIPKTDNTYDIGSSTRRFKDIHTKGTIDLNLGVIKNVKIDPLSSDPIAGNEGRLIYRTDLDELRVDDGTTFKSIGVGITKGWELIGDVKVTGTAVGSITFSGLDGDTDFVYMVVAYFINADTVANQSLDIRINNDTGLNYDCEPYLYGDGTNVATGTVLDKSYIGFIGAKPTEANVGQCLIFAPTGKDRVVLDYSFDATRVRMDRWYWRNTIDNITSLVFVTTNGTFIDVNSRICLFRLKTS